MRTKIIFMVALLLMMGSVNAAPPVTSGLVMHLEADSLDLADGASVSSWTDLSGSGNHATQTTGTAQPTYVASNATFNNHATVSFDGSSDYMDLNGSMITVDSFTLFIVGNFDVINDGGEHYFISAQGGSGNDRLRVAHYSWGSGFMTRIGNTGDKNLGAINTDAAVIAVTGTADAWLNDGAKQTVGTNTAGALNPSDFALGCYNDQAGAGPRDFLNGDLSEVILYNRVLTDEEVQLVLFYLSTKAPYDPEVIETEGATSPELVFNWKAAADPTGDNAVDPNIADEYVFMTSGSETDPNLYYLGATGVDPSTTDPNSKYPTTGTVAVSYETTYDWAVVEAMDGSTQSLTVGVSTLDAVDPNNLIGPTWSYTTMPKNPTISAVSPAYTAVDADLDPNVVLSVIGTSVETYQWYEETIGALPEGSKYKDVDTDTLTIVDVEQADEGYYYCIGSKTGTPDAVSPSGRVMIHRLTSHYPFEEINNIVDGNSVTPDIVGGFDAILKYDDPDIASLPTLNEPNAIVGTYCMQFDNADHATDPNGQFLQIYPGVVDYEDITITAWVHPKAIAPYARIFDFSSSDTSYFFLTPDIGSGYDARCAIRDGGDAQNLYADLDWWNWIGLDVWHHVAVTISGDTGRIFVNGQYRAKNTGMTINPLDIGATLNYIGKSRFSWDYEFAGYIDELKIYNYAQTNEKIAQDYLAISGGDRVCDVENNDTTIYDRGWEDPELGWIGGNNNCKIDLPDFASMAARWLEDDNFHPAP